MQAPTEIQLLGCFKLYTHGTVARIPLQAQRLVALLAVRDIAIGRHRLAEQLWPYTPQHRAYANLRTALWHVRGQAPSTVEVCHDSVELGAQISVDYHELQRSDQLGATAMADREVIGSLKAELLPGWDEDWLTIERERARQMRMRRLERLSGELLSAGRTAEAIDAAFTSIEIEPLRESAHLALIEAHLGGGNRAEAAHHAERVRALFRKELAIAPSVQFCDRISELELTTSV